MKLIILLAFLALMLIHNEAQLCRGRVRPADRNCVGGMDSGTRRASHCLKTANDHMWYYSNKTLSCRRMAYRGCGGNKNRYCSLASCENNCVRSRSVRPIIKKVVKLITTKLNNTNVAKFDKPTLAASNNKNLADFSNPTFAEFDNETFDEFGRETFAEFDKGSFAEFDNETFDEFGKDAFAEFDKGSFAEFDNETSAEFDDTTDYEPADQGGGALAKFGIF